MENNVSLEEAMEIIKKVRNIYNRVTTYERCYVFTYDTGAEDYMVGGVGAPLGVVKDTGKVVSFPELIADGFAPLDEIIEENRPIDLTK